MFERLKRILQQLHEAPHVDHALIDDIKINVDNGRYSLDSTYEEDVLEILSAFKTSRLPLDNYYYDIESRKFYLVSHVFHEESLAKRFIKELKDAFTYIDLDLKHDNENRSYVFVNPVSIDREEFARFVSLYRIELFKTPQEFYNPKNMTDAKFILDSLRGTDMPMDQYYWNYESNMYYIVSHVFHDYVRVNRYKDKYSKTFGISCADIQEDLAGRYFLNLNPASLDRKLFLKFIEDHRVTLFENAPDQSVSLGDDYFSASLDVAKYMLSMLRMTRYPFDTLFYERNIDAYYLVTHVFSDEARSMNYQQMLKKTFGESSVVAKSDIEGRWFVYLNPAYVIRSVFERFAREYAIKLHDIYH